MFVFCALLSVVSALDTKLRILRFGFPGQGQICLEVPPCNYYYY
jgi:hypothetical protein